MFYFFHHMPKCGGTSFKKFLGSVLDVHEDYHVGNANSHPEKYLKYQNTPLDLTTLNANDCVAGHYNMPGIYLWERYPDLLEMDKRMFTILRDPFETAKSGVRFGIKRGWLASNMTPKQKTALVLKRANFISKSLGINKESQIDEVLDHYWLIAPLDRIDIAAKVINHSTGKTGLSVEVSNVTQKDDTDFLTSAKDQFSEAADLDIQIFNRAVTRFDRFLSGTPFSKDE